MNKPQQVTMNGTVATDARIVKVDDKEYPICILLENLEKRRAMSAAMTPQQAYEFGAQLMNAAKEHGGVHNG